MRQALVNENSDMMLENPNYIMRITGDNQIGKDQLENFIDVEEKYPTIVTTSKLLTTGADSSFSVQNIYDIAGNVMEWTLEKTSSADDPCASRGGIFSVTGSEIPAAFRSIGSTDNSNFLVGFRVSLF